MRAPTPERCRMCPRSPSSPSLMSIALWPGRAGQAQRHARLGAFHRRRTRRRRRRAGQTVPRKTSSASRASPSVPLTHRSSPGACAAAQQGLADRDLAKHGDAQVQRAACVVSPPTSSMPWRSASANSPRANGATKASSARGSASASVKASGFGAAGGQVAQVDRQRLVAQALGRHGGQEVPALDQHVAGHCQLLPGGHGRSSAQSSPGPAAVCDVGRTKWRSMSSNSPITGCATCWPARRRT
jgi:hypothetical protein